MRFVLVSFLLWRIALFFIAFLTINFIPLRTGFLGHSATQTYLDNPLIFSWANFDGLHYLSIAQNNYSEFEQAFFPLYPLIIKYLSLITFNDYFVAGFSISYLSFLFTLLILYRLILIDHSIKIARLTIVLILTFPASFFFGSVYSESLFLFFIISSFYCARTKKWFLAGLLAALAASTRLIGIFLWPALILEFYLQNKSIFQKNNLKILPVLIIPGLGLLSYMAYLSYFYHDPLLFFHVQNQAWQRTDLVFPLQVFWRYIKMFWLTFGLNLGYYIAAFEFLSVIFFIFVAIFSFFRVRISYLFFALSAFILPMFSGTFLSMPRFIVILFPFFIGLAQIKSYRKIFILGAVFTILLLINTLLFVRGWWVA